MRELYDAWQKLSFIEPGYLIISWIIACLAILFAVALVIRWIRVPPKTRGSRYPLIHGSWFWAMIMGVVSLMTFAAARPYLKDKSGILETGNVRVIVIVDHSISMRAKDLGKERLEVAKDEISKLPDILKTGDQVALFVFAKSSRCKMPLSSDFDRFVNEVQDIGFPGHLYGDEFVWDTDYPLALGHVVEILDAQAAFRKEIGIKFSSRPSTGPIILFLLSDGDDQVQEEEKIKKDIAEFRKRDIHIYPIGIGTAHGVPLLSVLNGYKKISDYPEDLEKDWAGITTRLETGTLARLGRETDGRPPFLIENKEMSARDYMKGIIGFHRSIVLEPSGDDVREDQELWWQILCAAVLLLAVAILFDR